MKRFFAIVMTVLMLSLVLCGCSEKNENEGGTGKKTYKVGIVQFVDDASLNQIEKNIEKQLDAKAKELGVVFNYQDYTYNGQADATILNQIAASLIAEQVDIIVPIATPAAQIMQAATEDLEIPMVFSAVSDPISAGLAESLSKPGGKFTGTSDALDTEGLLDIMLAANPDTDYVGLLYSKSEDSSKKPIEEAKQYLTAKGIRFIEKTGTKTDEVISAVDALIAEDVDAVFTPTDNTIMTAEMSIYEKLIEAKIPHFCGADSFALNGAFCGYGVDYAELGVETANMVVEILVNGAKTETLAVKTFNNGRATVNIEVCEMLGYDADEMKTQISALCSEYVETKLKKEFD